MDPDSANNKVTSIILICTFTVFVLALILSEWDALTSANYNLHELIFIIRILSLLMLPLVGIIWFIFWKIYQKNKAQPTIKRTVLNSVSLLLFVMAIILPIIILSTTRTSGTSLTLKKYTYDGIYYVELDNHSIQVTKDKYDEIEGGIVQGYAYIYEYQKNSLFLDKNTIFFVEIEKIKTQN